MRDGTRVTAKTGTLHPGVRMLLVFVGGAVGAVLRTVALAPFSGTVSGGTSRVAEVLILTAVNVSGAFLLGTLVASVAMASPRADATRALIGTGLLGGFTSYSSLVMLATPMGGAWSAGIWLGLASLPLGVAAAATGIRTGEAFTSRSGRLNTMQGGMG